MYSLVINQIEKSSRNLLLFYCNEKFYKRNETILCYSWKE